MSAGLGLTRVPLPVLEQILLLIASDRVECPCSEAALLSAGLRGPMADVAQALGGLEQAAAMAVLRVAIAERVHRPPPKLDLVWTGPETHASVAQSTGLVVERMFELAQRTVIVGGYKFDRAEIFRPLHRAMQERGVEAWFFLDIDGETEPEHAERFATEAVDRFFAKVWTFGLPRPQVFYDLRTAIRGDLPGHEWATLHAKCVVVDDHHAFITSANFTSRAQTRNIEAGVLIEDPRFASELAGHWRQLVSEGLVKKYAG